MAPGLVVTAQTGPLPPRRHYREAWRLRFWVTSRITFGGRPLARRQGSVPTPQRVAIKPAATAVPRINTRLNRSTIGTPKLSPRLINSIFKRLKTPNRVYILIRQHGKFSRRDIGQARP